MTVVIGPVRAAPANTAGRGDGKARQVAGDRTNYGPGRADYSGAYGAEDNVDAVTHWQPLIEEASRRFGIPAGWIARVMRAESAGRTTRDGRAIRSPAGAMGLMQLMPATWAEMRARLGLGSDPDEPRANILAGTLYLRLMHDRFGYPGLFGAYNAGPARYAAYLGGRQHLPGETRAYLAQVAGRDQHGDGRTTPGLIGGPNGDLADASARPAAVPRPLLFVVRRDGPSEAASLAEPAPATGLFAILKAAP
ncbi:lytic transglycosylase domain-containing protein [Novosphingobium sp. G106]|nr:lytic transglycosylase domain-containing protein [Novosphingobium sp. G106]